MTSRVAGQRSVIILLFVITIINYLDRSSISYAMPLIKNLFGLSTGQTGLILGAFGIGYILTSLIGGFFVDLFGAKRSFLVIVLLWSLAIGWTGASIGFAMMFASRILLGLAEGPSFPAITNAIGHQTGSLTSASRLSGALVAVPLSLALGGPLVSLILVYFDWRLIFFLLALTTLLWLPLWLFVLQRTKADLPPMEAAHLFSGKMVKTVLTNKTLVANYCAYFLFGYLLFFYMTWLPTYLQSTYHIKIESVGLLTVLPWLVAAGAMVLVGLWSDAIIKKTQSFRQARTYLIVGSQFISAVSILPILYFESLAVALTCITISVAAIISANSVYYAVVTDIAPQYPGTAMGMMTLVFAVAGFIAPSITGEIVQKTGSFSSAFLLMSGLTALSIIIMLALHHPDRDRPEGAASSDSRTNQ
ncbi:MFS transporter [Flexibacterium corallicola]|uniref:MFS transporter n=1 Tax=Flexibacterium corallicola TaxID=3037259 RepID=UPI00286EBC17|nr:MFS transporter [Pseudovibrio sp. M1P-2-3]